MPDKDDITGEPLVQRSDDREDVSRVRIGAYNARTRPIISYYVDWERSGDPTAPRFIKMNGQGPAAAVCDRFSAAVSELTM